MRFQEQFSNKFYLLCENRVQFSYFPSRQHLQNIYVLALKQRTVRYKICDRLSISYLWVLLCILSQKGVPLLYVAPLWLFLILLMQCLLYIHFKTECRISFVHNACKQPSTRTILNDKFSLQILVQPNFKLQTIIKCKDLKFLQFQ